MNGMKRTRRMVMVAVATGAVTAGSYLLARRSWHMRWCVNDTEVGRRLPGDDRLADPRFVCDMAVTIDASPATVWPWLTQLGAGRGGWYSYDWVDRLLGVPAPVGGTTVTTAGTADGWRSAGGAARERASEEAIVPTGMERAGRGSRPWAQRGRRGDRGHEQRIAGEFQRLEPGNEIPTGRGRGIPVLAVDQERLLLLGGTEGAQSNGRRDRGGTVAFVLDELAGGRTRLSARLRYRFGSSPGGAVRDALIGPPSAVMMRRMLLGIKQRAEQPPHAPRPPLRLVGSGRRCLFE